MKASPRCDPTRSGEPSSGDTRETVTGIEALSGTAWQLALFAIVIVLSACTFKGSLRPTVNLQIADPVPHTVQAWGYPAPSGESGDSVYYSLGVNLAAARPFRIAFPDGHRADSRSIDAATLAAHLAPVERDERGAPVSRISISDGPRRYVVAFSLDPAGAATHMWVYACNVKKADVLGTADGSRWFGFPIRQREIEELFGGPVLTGHDFAILGTGCDSYVP